MGFSSYFLIVYDFILWSKDNDVPVGPGRGSGAGSLVAFALGITTLDPIDHGLLFERFLNPERISMPDFDIDFCMEKRDSVIEYVSNKYGSGAVSQIATFGTMAARAVVRDVARALGKPYAVGDRISKMIPFAPGMTLDRAKEEQPIFAQASKNDPEVKEVVDLAYKLEGIARNVGKHAGGVVIAPGSISDFCPVYNDRQSASVMTQYDKDDVEKIGLVKFDFLGLRTLTVIDRAVKSINSSMKKNESLDLDKIPHNDSKVFELLSSGKTMAIFQLESTGMRALIKSLKPTKFEEITALLALYRPGPLNSGMHTTFVDRKHGKSPVIYPHELLEPVLSETYGVIVYQEQVMEAARVLAPVMIIGHEKGRDTEEKVRRNFGMPQPEGYRKAKRLMQFAEQFSLPVITFIDTAGAYPGVEGEERGQSEAIARNLAVMSELKTPIIVVVTGEGGSGGALAISVGDHLSMLQYATYSVASPEACSSIIWRTPDKASEAADAMKVCSHELLKINIIDEIISEPLGGAHRDYDEVSLQIKHSLIQNLAKLSQLSSEDLVDRRYKRLLQIGI